MADPVSTPALAAIGLGTQVGSGILGIFGQKKESEAAAAMHSYRAGLARQNAAIQRQNAVWSLDAGEATARRIGLTTGFTIAKQKVVQAGSGFDVNSGTASEVREAQREAGLEDQTAVRTTAGRQALNQRNRAATLDAEARMEDRAASGAIEAGKINMFSTLLGTAGSVAGKWAQWGKIGGAAQTGITSYDENFLPVAYTPT